ncbi:MAG TPA: iron export ABC transporter permease subunit FetB [Caulobacteraceae bacterium]|jgi:putative ABC transport system permease protein
MNAISLSPTDLAVAGSLIAFDALLSILLKLNLHRQVLWSAVRMVVQLVAIGYLLRLVFALHSPAATVVLVVVMAMVAAREIAVRPERRFKGAEGLILSSTGVAIATAATVALALLTAIRPHPWYEARYAISLAGIVLGSVLNSGSLALDTLLTSITRERPSIEAQLGLGESFQAATRTLVRQAIRRGLMPIVNQMSAAGVITLPGIMTGQILAGLDPVEAVKYQILLMFLLAGASGLSAAIIAYLALGRLTDERQRLRLDRLR